MAQITTLPMIHHLRSDPSQQILHFRKGKLIRSGRGLAFWFRPLSSSVAEVPVDDRELPFFFRGRSGDFQEVVVQGVVSFRITHAEKIAERIDFTIDLQSGNYRHKPLEKLSGLVTDLSQQLATSYLVHTDLATILKDGVESICSRIEDGLHQDAGLETLGLEIVSARVSAVQPESEVERALQVRVREKIQQEADEATFQRRALAVEKERAIQENELQNQIELAKREEQLIAQRGENDRQSVTNQNDAQRIDAEGAAARASIESKAKAEGIRLVEESRVNAERERMLIYRDFPADRLIGLAAQQLAGKLQKIEHLNLSPDLLGSMLTNLVGAGTQRLESTKE